MILIVGYGNPRRGDDGAGIYAVRRLAGMDLPGVETRTVHQLQTEILEDAVRFDAVILVDAAEGGGDVTLNPVQVSGKPSLASSHHLGPELLVRLGQILYGKNLSLFICAIPGENFAMTEELSARTREAADRAVGMIAEFIRLRRPGSPSGEEGKK